MARDIGEGCSPGGISGALMFVVSFETGSGRSVAMLKTEEEIRSRIDEIKRELALIDKAASQELANPFFSRRRHVMEFFDLEKRRNEALLRELQWLIHAA